MSDTTQTTDQILTTLNGLGRTLAGWPDEEVMSSYVSEIRQNLEDADAGAEAASDASSSVESSLYDATSYAETVSQEAGSAQEYVNAASERMDVLAQRISALSEIRDTVLGTISELTDQVSALSPSRQSFVLSDAKANTLLDICEGVLGLDNVRILVGVLQMTLTNRADRSIFSIECGDTGTAPPNSPVNGTEDLDVLRGLLMPESRAQSTMSNATGSGQP